MRDELLLYYERELTFLRDMGGEFAQKMRGLYDYFDRRLQESNMAKTEPGIIEVLKHVAILRDAWSEMLQLGGGTVNTALPQQGASPQPGSSPLSP